SRPRGPSCATSCGRPGVRRSSTGEAIDPTGRRPVPVDCIVHLGPPEGRWSMVIAGAQVLAPGTVVWALCPGWLRRDGDRLWCQRGVWADRAGQMYLDDFSPPREVTYFANFLTRPGTYGERSDGEPLEAELGCPQSSCTELAEFVSCKVTTRLLAACAGVAVPHSIALTSRPPRGLLVTHRHPHVVVLDGAPLFARASYDGEDAIRRIREWIAGPLGQWPDWVDRVVVKPSGLMHLQGRGIRILPRADAHPGPRA